MSKTSIREQICMSSVLYIVTYLFKNPSNTGFFWFKVIEL